MSSNDLTVDLKLKTSVEEIWSYWIDPCKLEKWLTVKANVEPMLNGLYELFWEPDSREQNSTIGCKFIAFVPNKLIAFQWKGPVPFADLMNTEPPPTWVSVSLEAINPECTTIHFRHSGWGESDRWKEARSWQEQAWSAAFKELLKINT